MLLAGFRDGPCRFCIRLALHGETDGRRSPSGRCPSRRTMPTHPPSPAPLCAAQARPARRSGR